LKSIHYIKVFLFFFHSPWSKKFRKSICQHNKRWKNRVFQRYFFGHCHSVHVFKSRIKMYIHEDREKLSLLFCFLHEKSFFLLSSPPSEISWGCHPSLLQPHPFGSSLSKIDTIESFWIVCEQQWSVKWCLERTEGSLEWIKWRFSFSGKVNRFKEGDFQI